MQNEDKSKEQLVAEMAEMCKHIEKLESDYVQTQIELKEVKERLHNLFEGAGDSIFMVDSLTLQVLDSNMNAARRLGYTLDELCQLSWPDIEMPKTKEELSWKSTFSNTMISENMYRHKDGSQIPVESSSRLVRYADQDVLQVFARDITERKRAEQQRLELKTEKQRVDVLQRFISDASHDLRTPLTSIKTSLFLLQQLDDPEKHKKHLTVLERQTEHLECLLEDMLCMSRLDRVTGLELAKLNLNLMVADVLTNQSTLAYNKGQNINFAPVHDLRSVEGNKEYLCQAVEILVLNALHYMPDGGTMTVRVYEQEQSDVVEIQDTGMGISPEDLPRIFERFYRGDKARGTYTGGTGLGLAIARRIVELHRGNIEVECEKGKGSTFRVVLPVGTKN